MGTFNLAKAAYEELGVDVDVAINTALQIPISVHCWQADDVGGFEVKPPSASGGGIMATGNFPGKARNADEVRQDYDEVFRLVPGAVRANLHASYAETHGKVVDRDEVSPEHFENWIQWASDRKIGLDFNPTYFAHPLADSGYTLSSADESTRAFWVRHGIASREVASKIASRLSDDCVNNHWIPDGAKDSPVDRWGPRARLTQSLDAIFAADYPGCVDAVESKLFGLGSEDYVVGSFEFYTQYALRSGKVFCLDMGHFHPTESVADKLSSLLQFQDRILIHASRPMRWDSDHVVLFNDDLRAVFQELVRGTALNRAIVALDFFDASINRIGAYVVGIRAVRKAILSALLEPVSLLQQWEAQGRGAQKLALLEELKTLPFGAIWDELCLRDSKPVGRVWIEELDRYSERVLAHRST